MGSPFSENGDDRFYAFDDEDDSVFGGAGYDWADVDDEPWYAPWQAEDYVSGVESRTNH